MSRLRPLSTAGFAHVRPDSMSAARICSAICVACCLVKLDTILLVSSGHFDTHDMTGLQIECVF